MELACLIQWVQTGVPDLHAQDIRTRFCVGPVWPICTNTFHRRPPLSLAEILDVVRDRSLNSKTGQPFRQCSLVAREVRVDEFLAWCSNI